MALQPTVPARFWELGTNQPGTPAVSQEIALSDDNRRKVEWAERYPGTQYYCRLQVNSCQTLLTKPV